MSAIELFQYESTELRTVIRDGEPWFVAADVARILEYRMASDMTRRLDDEDKGYAKVRTPSGDQGMSIISESGLYDAIFRSNSDGAKPFRRWVTGEVMPAIRKTGSYSTTPALTGPALIAAALIEAQAVLAEKDERIAELEPKANYVDVFVTDSDLLSVRTVASTLGVQETWLRQELVSRKWIYVEHSSRWSESKGKKVPLARYSEYSDKKAYFQRVENHDAPRFRGEVMHTLKVTAAGANAIARIVPRWARPIEGDAA